MNVTIKKKTMKKISIYLFSLAITVVGMTSCGKSTKGKIANEWKVASLKSVETSINSNGDKQIYTFSVDGNTITDSEEHYPASGPSSSSSKKGTMNANEFVIKKDGTWSWVIDGTYTSNNGASTRNEILEQAGTWSFLNKSKGDDFKKNERVLFNVLTVKSRDIVTENGVVVDDYTDNLVYSTGKNTMIYTVKDSKKDKLELESEAENIANQNTFQSSNSTSRTITLESK
jgi:hypothetical protein